MTDFAWVIEAPGQNYLATREIGHPPAQAPCAVTLRAYEVYSHIQRPQEAMITGGCRGGFGAGEIIAFLYARSFPKTEWEARVREALTGMQGI